MKVLSFPLAFPVEAQPVSVVVESENNHSFDTRQFLLSATNTVDGQIYPGNVDSYTFPGLNAGELFNVQVNSNTVDPLLGLLDDSGKPQLINDDRSDLSILPELTGIVPTSGKLTFGVSGLRDINLTGEHFESGSYTLSLKTFPLPKPSTNATLINGSFETSDFIAWTTLGENTIETSAFGSSPTQGTFQALLSTGGVSFANPIIEQFLGLKAESLDNLVPFPIDPPPTLVFTEQPAQGSAIQQTFTAEAGDILAFDWNFFTNELPTALGPSLSDFSFVSISSPLDSISYLEELADVTTFPSLVTSPTQFLRETGFHTFSFTIPTTGTYTLGLGVTNKFDNFTDSGLLVDNVTLTSVTESTSVLA
ncbi:hypothetical protein [Scytonema sp. PCC 10023]|uniref:hypothetical protein n=1 Tax=Scytonema sp. PCC 10023 TaxID=1680591 RepID=UPI0039C699EE